MASARSEDSIWFSTVFARQETPRNATAGLYVRSDGWYDGRNWNTDSASRLLADWAKQTNTFLLPASRLQDGEHTYLEADQAQYYSTWSRQARVFAWGEPCR